MTPIITLITDFGLSDSYLAEVKAVILSKYRQIQIVDITHLVPKFDISSGAFQLLRSYARFPPGTYHLAVVDPGVGSPRLAVYASAGGYHFMGPDNGILKWAVKDAEAKIGQKASIFKIPIQEKVAPTFHARDIFAPALVKVIYTPPAGWQRIEGLEGKDFPGERELDGIKRGEIVAVDHFGNVVTSITATGDKGVAQVGNREDRYAYAPCYSAIEKGKVGLIRGSHGLWELAANCASAKELLQIKIGDEVTLRDASV